MVVEEAPLPPPPAEEPVVVEEAPLPPPPAEEPVVAEEAPLPPPPAEEPVVVEEAPLPPPPAEEPVVAEEAPLPLPPAEEPVVAGEAPLPPPPAEDGAEEDMFPPPPPAQTKHTAAILCIVALTGIAAYNGVNIVMAMQEKDSAEAQVLQNTAAAAEAEANVLSNRERARQMRHYAPHINRIRENMEVYEKIIHDAQEQMDKLSNSDQLKGYQKEEEELLAKKQELLTQKQELETKLK